MDVGKALEELIIARCERAKCGRADMGEELKGIAELVRALAKLRNGGR